jgi:hypothetical protein
LRTQYDRFSALNWRLKCVQSFNYCSEMNCIVTATIMDPRNINLRWRMVQITSGEEWFSFKIVINRIYLQRSNNSMMAQHRDISFFVSIWSLLSLLKSLYLINIFSIKRYLIMSPITSFRKLSYIKTKPKNGAKHSCIIKFECTFAARVFVFINLIDVLSDFT